MILCFCEWESFVFVVKNTAVLKEYTRIIARHYNPSVRAAEVIDSLAENFKMRPNNFRSHTTNIRIFEPYSPLK
jgi:hypothetical protein